jgi:hypothetical protein
VPIDHDAAAAVAYVPFGHQVWSQAPNFFESEAQAIAPSLQIPGERSRQIVENMFGATEGWLGIDHPVLLAEFGEEVAECARRGKLPKRAMELEPVVLEQFTKPRPELAAEAAAKCLDWQEEAWRKIDSSGTIGSQAAGGNDVVDMGMMTSTTTIP